jgi:hydrogenase nickel incorporation protein HypA/HybF
MHEAGIVQSIIGILEQQAQLHKFKRIVRVSLEFGALTAVLPDSVRFAFDILSKDTVAENAALDIAVIPLKVRCGECSKEQVLEVYQPFCPSCESSALQIVEGRDEMRIAYLEVED